MTTPTIQVDGLKTIGPTRPADSPNESKSEGTIVASAPSPQLSVSHHLTAEQLGRLSSDPRVIDCLKKFNFSEVPVKNLAEHVGFDQNELKMLDIFWDAEFNNSWIYLSPKIICEDLKYSSVAHFAADVLMGLTCENGTNRYINGVDWMEVPKTHELVVLYNKLIIDPSIINDVPKKRGPVVKHYIVRGKTFKKIVARASKADAFRDYFLKVEELAILMRDFMNALLKYNLFQRDEELERHRAESTRVSAEQSAVINQLKDSLLVKNSTGWFYIASSNYDLKKNHFKLGITENLDSRLGQYSTTFSTEDTRVWYCDYWSVHEPGVIEKATKVLLKPFNLKIAGRTTRDESYYMNYNFLHKLVAQLCAGHSAAVEYTNHLLSDYEAIITRPSLVVPKPPPQKLLMIEMKIATGDSSITIPLDIDNMSADQQAHACEEIINAFVRTKVEVDASGAEMPKVPITWCDLETFINSNVPRGSKTKVKYATIKNVIGRIAAGIRSIDYRARKARA